MIKNIKKFIWLILPFLIISCGDEEVGKKVSLYKRTIEIPKNSLKQPDADTLKFGFDLRLGPREDVRIYLPFLRYLEQYSGYKFSLRFTEKYEDTVENLGRGITHFAALGPVNCVLAKEKYGANCLVMGLNAKGKPEYRAVIITQMDSPIKTIKDLRGRSFAFGDKFSTQGHIIPRKMLEDEGLRLADLKNYIFTGSHGNTARAIMNGEYEAGGMQDTLAYRLAAKGKVRIIALSKPFPSSLICVHKGVNSTILKTVTEVLLLFDPQNKHAGILTDWEKTEMPNGFTTYKDGSLNEIKSLVFKYGLMQ
ncbi:MAG: phosphate/phosphite/phosphonate ABC transporter substrate-binding protein [Thermodesulfobacteriota bacterium]